MLWILLAAVMLLVAVGVAFDVVARRRGSYRPHGYYAEASKQRRAQRINVLHTLYDRRAGERHVRGHGDGRR